MTLWRVIRFAAYQAWCRGADEAVVTERFQVTFPDGDRIGCPRGLR